MKINGKEYDIGRENTLYEWVSAHVNNPSRVAAAEVNGEIYSAHSFNDITLKSSDVIELVYFVGGG